MPGYGSEGFRREPALAFVESTETSPGCWQTEVAQARYSCGTYRPFDWTKDAIALAPGERVELAVELAATPRWHTRWQTGRTSVRLRYAYTAGATVTRGRFPIPKTLQDTAPFQVLSNEVELVYVAPLRLTMAPRPRALGSTSVLQDDVVSLSLENLSSSRRDVLLPSERTLRFEVRGEGQIKASWQPGLEPTPVAVGAGEHVALIGPSGVNAGLEYALLDVDREAPLVIRAVYRPFEDRGAWLPSEWVVLDLR